MKRIRSMRGARIVPTLLAFLSMQTVAQTWQSAIVSFGQDGKLAYAVDPDGNSVPDFSFAGYKNGEEPLPDVPVVRMLAPLPGDNTAHIQAAIDSFSALPMNASGIRGALLLQPGRYRVAGTIRLNVSGVVLRGSGQDTDSASNTIIFATGDTPHQRTVLIAGGPSQTRWADQVVGTKTDVLSDTVKVGERVFEVANASPFVVGDNVVIVHPCTGAWLSAIDSGGTATDASWTVGEQPIIYNRYITSIVGNWVEIDAPVFNHLVRALSQSYVYRYARTNMRSMIGIEDLSIVIEASGLTTDANGDENHAWDAVLFQLVEDAWARRVTTLHFGQSGFKTATASRVTIEDCSALEPVGVITGERRYNFNTYTASQLILFKNCVASYGRHDFVSNGTSSVSGIVFTGCRSMYTYASSEGHRRWSQGMLFDDIVFEQPKVNVILGLYNRGSYGTGHGWASVHSVAWNVNLGSQAMVVQKPPTAQNYAIGCSGVVTGEGPFAHPAGYIESSSGQTLVPASLWAQQLQDRVGSGNTGILGNHSNEGDKRPSLHPNVPNPFNPSTTISFSLPISESIEITIVDLIGREVKRLAEGFHPAGIHSVSWNAEGAATGVYFCVLRSQGLFLVRPLTLVR